MVNGEKLRYSIAIISILIIFLLVSSCGPTIYDLTTLVNPSGSGTVSPSSGAYEEGTSVKLTAQPAQGYRFDYWSGNATGTSNPLDIIMDSAKTITANFKIQYLINVSMSPESGGTVIPSQGIFDEGAQVELTAQPAPGYRFDYWSGDATGSANPLIFIADGEKVITAHFIAQYELNVLISPSNSGTVSPRGGIYDEGTQVNLSAQPALGYSFGSWSGDITGTANNINIIMSGNKTITANFIPQYMLTISVSPEGAGSVTPAGGYYDQDSRLTLTAVAAEGFAFDHWSGDAAGTSESITFIIDSDKHITANFVRILTMGVDTGPYIWVDFPDVVDGNDGYLVNFNLAYYVLSGFIVCSTEITEYDPTSGNLSRHYKIAYRNFVWSDYKLTRVYWEITIYSVISNETWIHEGRFYNVVYDGNQIVSFKATIDGINYSYP